MLVFSAFWAGGTIRILSMALDMTKFFLDAFLVTGAVFAISVRFGTAGLREPASRVNFDGASSVVCLAPLRRNRFGCAFVALASRGPNACRFCVGAGASAEPPTLVTPSGALNVEPVGGSVPEYF